MYTNKSHSDDGCALDCAIDTGRREFLRDAALTVAGALIAMGLSPRRALATPLSFMDALKVDRDKVTYPIPVQDGATIDKDKRVILVRWENNAYAFSITCPHQNTVLRWLENDHRFQCPKHESKYQPDGTFISGRATRGMDRYGIAREGDNLVVDTSVMKKESDDREGWLAAVVKL
jgi:Rieske Fe-S protein